MAFNIWDVRSDTPINNFATMNPLNKSTDITLSEGNLKVVGTGANWDHCISTFSVTDQKIYFEVYVSAETSGTAGYIVGLCNDKFTLTQNISTGTPVITNFVGRQSNTLYNHSSSNGSFYTSTSAGDIIRVYYDGTRRKAVFSTESEGHAEIDIDSGIIGDLFILLGQYGSTANLVLNTGQDATFAGNKIPTKVYTDSNGQGRFFYEPPAGALALCTRNLATPKNVPAEYIVDETNQHLLTYNGNTQVSKFSPYATDGYSIAFDGNSQQVKFATSADFELTGNATVEMWVYLNSAVAGNTPLYSYGNDAGTNYFSLHFAADGKLQWYQHDSLSGIESTASVGIGQWHHIALVRDGNTLKVYNNGVERISSSYTASFPTEHVLRIGSWYGHISNAYGANGHLNGYIADYRVVNGTAVYTGAFTPPSGKLTATGGTYPSGTNVNTSITSSHTKLLLSTSSKQIVDTSASSKTVTFNGTPSIEAWSPYTSIDKQTGYELVTTENGGSFKFTGANGDYLATGYKTALSDGPFTIEGWYYFDGTISIDNLLSNMRADATGLVLDYVGSNNTLQFQFGNGGSWQGSTPLITVDGGKYNQWNYFMLTWDTSIYTLRVNENSATASLSTGITTTQELYLGQMRDADKRNPSGYIGDIRISNVARAFNGIPTSPLQSDANTELLLQPFQPKDKINSSFFNVTDNYAQDETGKALTYAGNVAVSASSPYKSGDYGSFSFGGQNSGDYIDLGNLGTDVNLTGSYTFEGWVYVIGNTSAGGIITSYDDAASGWRIIFRSNSKIVFEYFGVTDFLQLENTTSILNKWTHFVVVSNGTNVAGYIDGVKKATASHTTINGASTGGYTGQLMIGTNALDQASTWNMDGKIADLHFINGTAKYNPSDTTISVPYEPVTVDVNNSVLLAQPGKVADSENVAAKDPDAYMKAVTYAGDHPNVKTVNVGFQPDLVWIKSRVQTYPHGIWDSIRYNTGYEYLSSNTSNAQATTGDKITFTTNGFSVDEGQAFNTGGYGTNNNVAWCWKAGGTPSEGFTGTEAVVDGVETTTTALKDAAGASVTPSAMSVNTKAGFSIVEYTGPINPATITIPHGLGKRPSLMLAKNYENSGANYHWQAHFFYGTNSREVGYLNLTNAFGVDTTNVVNDNVIAITTGDINRTAGKNIAYIWAEIPGYSSIGKWTGNGTTTGDGPFVYTGFKPAFILWQNSDSGTGAWALIDGARDSYNPVSTYLYANALDDESTTTTANNIDFLSNGFKMRGTGGSVTNNQVCWYAAFAEAPVPYATAR